jgi:hypothetical protein
MARILVVIGVAASAATSALGSLSIGNATVQPAGPRTGANGLAFFNMEGSGAGNFASYGVARFDLSADKAALDALYGAGQWSVTGATLTLVESNAAFSHAGGIAVYFSADNATSILNDGSSPLRFDPTALPGGNNQAAQGLVREALPVASYIFPQTGTGNNGAVDVYNLTLTPGLLSRLQSGAASSVVTLVFEPQDPTVAATYAGFTNTTFAGPTLTIQATPAPGVATLLALGGLIAARRRR